MVKLVIFNVHFMTIKTWKNACVRPRIIPHSLHWTLFSLPGNARQDTVVICFLDFSCGVGRFPSLFLIFFFFVDQRVSLLY